MGTPGHRHRGQGGIALVAVLWLLLLLAVISGAMLRTIRADRAVAATAAALAAARLEDDGAINWAILTLLGPAEQSRWRLDGTPRVVHLFDRDLTVRIEAEAGKIDLNAAPANLLAALFRAQGVSTGDADQLAGRIIAWRTPLAPLEPDLAANAYLDANRVYGPRHAPFRSIGELRLVLGMTDALQVSVAPLVTIWSGSPSVDRGTAGDGVLNALVEFGDGLATGQLDARTKGSAAGVDRAILQGEAITIQASLDSNGVKSERSAVVRLGGTPERPYRVLAWW